MRNKIEKLPKGNNIALLAFAVIHQWHLDGEPGGYDIEAWYNILQESKDKPTAYMYKEKQK